MIADDVSAVIVTRGDCDLGPILESLPYPEVIIWDDRERGSQGCFGRYLVSLEASNPTVYFQDDDLIFTAHDELLALYDPEVMTVNMPSPWYENCRYNKLKQGLVGAGSVMDCMLPWKALDLYLEQYPKDDLFFMYCDVVVGMLTPYNRVDFGYEILEHASAPGRIYTLPGAPERKLTMQRRVMEMRDA